MNDSMPPAGNVQSQLNGPAMGLIIAGALGLLSQIILLLIHFGVFALNLPFAGSSMSSGLSMLSGTIGLALRVMGIAVNLFVIYGAMQMRSLKNYNLAIGAAIAAIIPCFSSCPCCFLGIGFGVWAIIILVKPEVKAAFQG